MNKELKSADQILFRCHALGDIMSGVAKGWPVDKSVTCMRRLVSMYREQKYGKRHRIETSEMQKGIESEEDAITLLNKYLVSEKKFTGILQKNGKRIQNDYLTGEFDVFADIEVPTLIDTKCAYTMHTMPSGADDVKSDYYWQGMGYMALVPEAQRHLVVTLLVNTPADIIDREKKSAGWRMNSIDPEADPEFKNICREIELNHIHDLAAFIRRYPYYSFDNDLDDFDPDVDISDRVYIHEVIRDESEIQKMYNRINECRTWMNRNLFKI